MIIILFICCRWTWLPNSRKIFVFTMMRDIGLQFYFLMLSLGLVSWQYWPQNPLGSVSSSFIFWKCLWRLWISSFYVWQNLSMKPRWAGLFFVARLLITNSASLFYLDLLRCSVTAWVSFGNLYFSGNWPILPIVKLTDIFTDFFPLNLQR